ncbi:MAG: hypothetical protein HQK54_12170 [Oligoflexales bacterium]|nr:hypothetical protein [Oligoflexales bacterium]
MSASCHEYKIELTDNVHAFFRQTGIILNHEELEWLGFQLKNGFTTIFGDSEVPLIIQFCEENPEYHIITMTQPGHIENRYVPGKRVYYLAKGDKNPNLVLNPFIGPNAPLFIEKVTNQALTIISDINRGNKLK